MEMVDANKTELWVCPKCGAKLAGKNMWHSCGVYELEPLFARCEPHVFRLYQRLEELASSIGPVTVVPQKTRLVMMVRVRFLGVYPRKSHLVVSLWLTNRYTHPALWKIEEYMPGNFFHFFRIRSELDYDAQFIMMLHEAYRIGTQR